MEPHRRGRNLAGRASTDGDEGLDLFSRRRSTIPITNESSKLDRLLLGSAKIGRGGNDLLDADIGKHDYDWLLTPPGTPLFPSSDVNEHQLPVAAPKNIPTRSVSTARASRLSTSQSESGTPARPARSSSVSRPSVTSNYSSHFSNNNRTAALNTSSSSVTSRPTTPSNRSTSLSTTRPSPPISQARSRPSTPVKTRTTTSSTGDKPRPLTISRSSTPTTRPHSSSSSNSNSNSSVVRPASRASTPGRRAPSPAPASVTERSRSVGRTAPVNGRNPGPATRPSSPGLRPRAPVQPIHLPDFPTDVPPNLRTKLPDRPLSTGRTRPGMALTVKSNSNSETPVPTSSNRRQSFPMVSRGKYPENPPKARVLSSGHEVTSPEIPKPVTTEPGARRPSKPATATESTGFGRTISKKSIDMALRHMDIRQSMGGIRGASLFPQSIRSAPSKGRPARTSDLVVPVTSDEFISGNRINNYTSNGEDMAAKVSDRECQVTREPDLGVYGSTRYEAMLLKEDAKDMNWLHNVEDKSDQSPVFDHRFEPLPEPFGLL